MWDHSDTSLKHRPLRKGLLWFWLLWIIGGGLIGLAAFFVDLEKWVDQWTVTSVLVERFSHHALREDVAGLDIPIRRHTTSRF